jgi:nicotinamidase-related amidase
MQEGRMIHPRCLRAQKSCLVVVDIQEKFRPVIAGYDTIAGRASTLIRGCGLLGVPVVATEQYPQGLGPTVETVKNSLATCPVLEKTSFSCTGADGFTERVRDSGASDVIVCGIETHVCVNQTVHALLHEGFGVHVAVDAVGSRSAGDHETALKKMFLSGAVPATVEMCLFEMLGDAKDERFRQIQSLVK